MIVKVGIYHSRYTGITASSADMSQASDRNHVLIETVEVEIDTPEVFDWAAHDARLKGAKIKELKAQLAKLEGGE